MNVFADRIHDEGFMRVALAQAREAAARGEVPVGAVIVRNGEVIATGHNAPICGHDPTSHAEINALRAAAEKMGNYRLEDCELYVTLEPCAMCSGAMLNARLKRVVFGAAEPRTGAAGSVVNLFDNPRLNHQTHCEGGVLERESAAILQSFFRDRRSDQRELSRRSHPLRDDALRTPDAAFGNLPDYPWMPNYVSDLPSLAGLRLHYLDEQAAAGEDRGGLTWLCLHGNPAWSYLYRKMIPVFLAAGDRVVAPDMPGFGKSDKPKKDSFHTFAAHRQILIELVERLDLRNVVLVVQDWGGILGLTLPMAAPTRYRGVLAMNTLLATGEEPLPAGFLAWREMCARKPAFDIARLFVRGNREMSAAECAAYGAPYPDSGHRAATRAFPAMVPAAPDSPGAGLARAAAEFFAQEWSGETFMAIGAQDPVLGPPVMASLQAVIRPGAAPVMLENAGHFVPERGVEVAQAALRYFTRPH